MTAILFLVPIALGLAIVFLVLFLAAVRNGQFDDLDDASRRFLHDD